MPSPSSMMLGSVAAASSIDEPDVIFGSKLLSWHRADLGVTLSGPDVDTWADQSGNGRDMTTGSNKPSMGTLGGQDAIAFDYAAAEELFCASYGSPSALHVIRVLERNADPPPASTASGLDWWGTSTARSAIPFATDGVIYDATGGSSRATVGNPTPSMADPCVYESILTGSKFDARLNGSLLYSGASLTVSLESTPRIGHSGGGLYYDGTIAEIIVLDAEASAGERDDLAAYILDRYGISM